MRTSSNKVLYFIVGVIVAAIIAGAGLSLKVISDKKITSEQFEVAARDAGFVVADCTDSYSNLFCVDPVTYNAIECYPGLIKATVAAKESCSIVFLEFENGTGAKQGVNSEMANYKVNLIPDAKVLAYDTDIVGSNVLISEDASARITHVGNTIVSTAYNNIYADDVEWLLNNMGYNF